MKTIGIIAEYNPFHNGHAWLISEAKRRACADYAIIVMSGDFVQRGEPAVADKFTRTKMALAGGADMVFELPVQYACGSAEYFARGAVSLLHRLGVIDTLCFGCETEDPDAFRILSDFLACEPDEFRKYLKQYLSCGNSFPKARFMALKSCLKEHDSPEMLSDLLSSPNNTLGLEYLLACKRDGCLMDFIPIQRQGADYHALTPCGRFASATAIRRAPGTAADYIPEESFSFLKEYCHASGFCTAEEFSAVLHYALLMNQDYSQFLDINPDLADRIRRLLPSYKSWGQFVSLLKTKQITEARIRRSLLHILLGIRMEIFSENRFPGLSWARLLGFKKTAAPLLGEIKKRGRIPLLSKTADSRKLLSGPELELFQMNLRASSIYHAVKHESSPYNEYRQPIILF